MKTIWKWVLGVLLVMLVVAGLFGAAFLWRGQMAGVSFRSMPFHRTLDNAPMMPGQDFDRRLGPMMRDGRGFRPFGGLFALGGGLVRLVIFGLLLYGAYWLGRRNARVVVDARAPAPTPPAPQASSQEPPAE